MQEKEEREEACVRDEEREVRQAKWAQAEKEEREARQVQREEEREARRAKRAHKERDFQLSLRKEESDKAAAIAAQAQERERERRKNKIASEIPPMGKLRYPKEIVHFLTDFREHMRKYKVDRDQWAVLLKPLLDAKSASFMDRLASDVKNNFNALSEALAKANGITPAYHCRRWYNVTWQEGLTPIEIVLALQAIG